MITHLRSDIQKALCASHLITHRTMWACLYRALALMDSAKYSVKKIVSFSTCSVRDHSITYKSPCRRGKCSNSLQLEEKTTAKTAQKCQLCPKIGFLIQSDLIFLLEIWFILDILYTFTPLSPSVFKQSMWFKVFSKHNFFGERDHTPISAWTN